MSEVKRIDRAHINLRGDAQSARFIDGVGSALGQDLPLAANTFTEGDHRIYWLGPDEWLVTAEPGRAKPLVDKLEDALAGEHVAINDQSGGQASLVLCGSDARDQLSQGCTLDLHPGIFGVGDCAQCGLAKANVLIACIDAAPVYEIIVRRTFSEYVLRWLHQTSHSRADSAFS